MRVLQIKQLLYLFIILAAGVLLIQVIDAQQAAQTLAREYLLIFGTSETGAINLVSSIYLGYRTFDTLGETIVLFLGVSGTILYMRTKD